MRNLWLICLLAGSLSRAQSDEEFHPRTPRVAISLETGVNSLASLFGAEVTWFVSPQWAIDVGAGLSVNGLRPGFHVRYLFSDPSSSRFLYGGVKYALGYGDENDTTETGFVMKPVGFADFGVGHQWLTRGGLFMKFTAGVSLALAKETYVYRGSEPPFSLQDSFSGSGPTFAFSIGKAF